MFGAVAAVVGLLTVYSMTKIWNEAFWKPRPDRDPQEKTDAVPMNGWLLAPVVAMALLTVFIGLSPGPVFELAQAAARELLEPAAYVYTVIGETR